MRQTIVSFDGVVSAEKQRDRCGCVVPPMNDAPAKIRPLDLRRTARAIASNYGDKGGVVITVGEGGVRIGVENLTPQELRDALCVAINYSFVFEDGEG
jgi:hypothetical protein